MESSESVDSSAESIEDIKQDELIHMMLMVDEQ